MFYNSAIGITIPRESEKQEEEMGAEVKAAVEVKRWDKRKLRKSNRLP